MKFSFAIKIEEMLQKFDQPINSVFSVDIASLTINNVVNNNYT